MKLQTGMPFFWPNAALFTVQLYTTSVLSTKALQPLEGWKDDDGKSLNEGAVGKTEYSIGTFKICVLLGLVSLSGASILNQRVEKRTGFGLVLNQTKSHLVFSHRNQTKSKPLYFFNIKTKPKPNKLIFFSLRTKPNLIEF